MDDEDLDDPSLLRTHSCNAQDFEPFAPLLSGVAACVEHREEWYTKQVGSLGKDLKVQGCPIYYCPAKKRVEVSMSNRVCEYADVKVPLGSGRRGRRKRSRPVSTASARLRDMSLQKKPLDPRFRVGPRNG